MKKTLIAILLAAVTATAAPEPRTADLPFDVQNNRGVRLNHKAYSGLIIQGTLTNSDTQAAIDITGATGSVGFKWNVTDTNFFAWTNIVVTNGPGGVFTATYPAAQWVTNISTKCRLYGDVRIPNVDNPLPSIELWLYPSANHGDETTYLAPTQAGWQTNGVAVSGITTVNFRSNLTSSVSGGVLTVDADVSGAAAVTNTPSLGAVMEVSNIASNDLIFWGNRNIKGQDDDQRISFAGADTSAKGSRVVVGGTNSTVSGSVEIRLPEFTGADFVVYRGTNVLFQIANAGGFTMNNLPEYASKATADAALADGRLYLFTNATTRAIYVAE